MAASKLPKFRNFMLGWGTVTAGTIAGSVWLYKKRLRENSAVTAKDIHGEQQAKIAEILKLKPDKFRSYAEQQAAVLYRFGTCPFCGTVKALLDYCSIPHSIVEVDPMIKTELKGRKYRKVPQLMFADGTLLVDSEEIATMLADLMGLKRTPEIEQWRQWARQQLSRYIVMDVNRTLRESVQAYEYIDKVENVPTWSKWTLKIVGGPVMYLVSKYKTTKTMKEQFGYDGSDIRGVVFQQMNKWIGSFPKGKLFHGGAKPDLADIEVYGILYSVTSLQLRKEIMGNTTAGKWLHAMDDVMAKNRKELKNSSVAK